MIIPVLLTILLFHFSIAFAALVLAASLFPRTVTTRRDRTTSIAALLAAHALAAAIAIPLTGDAGASLTALALGAAAAIPSAILLTSYSAIGRTLVAAQLVTLAAATAWALHYVLTVNVSATTRMLMLAGVPLALITLPFGVLSLIPQWEVLARQHWRRPRAALPPIPRHGRPKVSLHVPICSEPPDVVIATLDALRALDYPNFEVLVIDNNTRDESLWRPVQRWCTRDRRFRFFHLEHCPGAKAGALNFARGQTAPDATIVGLVDSDYQARPSFLSALVGYFDDRRVGFVQTPHDYREWEHSLYQRMCYWEYRSFFTVSLPSWNERGAAITVGTMALIRRDALEQAGGWSEWCLTEDSELAPRIHALGYTSVYVQDTFGRGLIPERFAGYAKQRRRWTYGPIQELKRHLPMLMPAGGTRTALTAAQKVFHLHHDLDPLFTGAGLLLLPLALAATASMIVNGDRPSVPLLAIAAGVIAALAGQVMSVCVQRRAMRCSFADVLCAALARTALAHCIATSALRAIAGVPLAWQRTDKFKARGEGVGRALRDARTELTIGLTLATIAGAGLASAPGGLLLLLLVGLAVQGAGYLVTPALALLAEWDLQNAAGAAGEIRREVEEAVA